MQVPVPTVFRTDTNKLFSSSPIITSPFKSISGEIIDTFSRGLIILILPVVLNNDKSVILFKLYKNL